MSNLRKQFLVLTVFIGLITSCNKNDDNIAVNYSEKMVNTIWSLNDKITQKGEKYDGLLKLTFETNTKGTLNTKTTGTSVLIDLSYSYTYTMSSFEKGVINFADPSLGTQKFTILNNRLKLNEKEYSKQ